MRCIYEFSVAFTKYSAINQGNCIVFLFHFIRISLFIIPHFILACVSPKHHKQRQIFIIFLEESNKLPFSIHKIVFPFQHLAKWITVSHHYASRLEVKSIIMEFGYAVETIAEQFLVGFSGWLPDSASHRHKQVSQSKYNWIVMRVNDSFDAFRTLLGDSQRHLYDSYKRVYAEMLYRWNLLLPRAKILKYISVPAEAYRDVEFVAECSTCMKVTRAPVCKECHNPMLKCSLCRLPVKGLANACLSCGHGGHTDHMKKWFSVSSGYVRSPLLIRTSY